MHETARPPDRGEQLLRTMLDEQRQSRIYLQKIHRNVTVIGVMIMVPFVLLFLMLALAFFAGIVS